MTAPGASGAPAADAPHPVPGRRAAGRALALAFLLAIAAPTVAWVATGAPDRAVLKELRAPAPAPAAPRDLAALERWPAAFEDWYDDAFGLRGTLLRWYNALVFLGLGSSPKPNTLVGKDGWIFLAEEALAEHRALDPFAPDELAAWHAALAARRDWLAARDARFVFLVAPDKHSIYPEQLPGWARNVGPRTRLDQLVAAPGAPGARDGARIVDVRAPLLAAKAEGALLYYPLGSHWNARGALVAYRALRASFEDWFALPPAPAREDFVEEQQGPGDSWATRMLIEDLVAQDSPFWRAKRPAFRLLESWPGPRGLGDARFEGPAPELPRICLVRDSFGDALVQFLLRDGSQVLVVSTLPFDAAQIDAFGPDLVICEQVERSLMLAVPPLPVGEDELARARAWLRCERVVPLVLAPDAGGAALTLAAAPGAAPPDARPAEGVLRLWRAPGAATRVRVSARAPDGSAVTAAAELAADRRVHLVPLGPIDPAGPLGLALADARHGDGAPAFERAELGLASRPNAPGGAAGGR